MKWVINQFEHFNILMLIVIFTFQVLMAKTNTQKLLKEQSQEFHAEFEQMQTEISNMKTDIISQIKESAKDANQ